MTTTNAQLPIQEQTIAQLARRCLMDWGNRVNYAAKPYLEAMFTMEYVDPKGQRYIADDAKGVILYFLNNAGTWRGEVAREVKAELRRRCS